ncbi:uncharacterized protein LOC143919927 [Arctopsyche grandis]|uniref:uncharacterized protein LOC143919927 n=1 Tax=Arctopsyche grandis TaxID=121162 RepID=UPI00406D6983
MYPVIVTGTEGNSTGRHVRCYCNLPQCVTTGYMCKSPAGGCFSELLSDVNLARHGCIETLDTGDHKAKCMNSPSSSAVRSGVGAVGAGQASTAFVLCCFRDLCNHVDSPQSRLRLNDTIAAGNWSGFPNIAGSNTIGQAIGAPGSADNNANEVWFRAATIAVPICGALILFLLIALAVKLLRTDALDAANKLSPAYTPHGSGQGHLETPLMKKVAPQRDSIIGAPMAASAPLLLSHANVVNICETTHAKPSASKCDCKEENCIVMQHYPHHLQSSPTHKTKQMNRDVNVNVAPPEVDGNSAVCANSKLYEKQLLPLNDKLYNKEAILYWGQAAAHANHCPR